MESNRRLNQRNSSKKSRNASKHVKTCSQNISKRQRSRSWSWLKLANLGVLPPPSMTCGNNSARTKLIGWCAKPLPHHHGRNPSKMPTLKVILFKILGSTLSHHRTVSIGTKISCSPTFMRNLLLGFGFSSAHGSSGSDWVIFVLDFVFRIFLARWLWQAAEQGIATSEGW